MKSLITRATTGYPILAVVLLTTLIAAEASAYRLIQQAGGAGTYTAGNAVAPGSGVTARWIQRPIDYRVNTNGAGDGLTFAQTRNAVTAAYNSWQNIACSNLMFNYAGGTTATRNATDGNNTTYWAELGAPEFGFAGILGPGTLAVTILTITADQEITDVDIAYNGRDFTWNLGSNSDVQGIAAHEIGHMIGFHHTNAAAGTPTMTGGSGAVSVALASLEPDDKDAACYLYPTLSGGSSVAAGDFNGDGRQDLAIGVPSEAIGSIGVAGAVNVIYGAGAGLTAAGDQLWHQNRSGIAGVSEQDDRFGSSFAAGDFDNDGFDDLAIGVPNEDIGTLAGAGAVNVLYGTAAGLSAANDQLWHQNTSGVNGVAEEGDQFGSSLTAGDFDTDGFDDLAIGAPGESIGALGGAGAINVLYGSASGLTAAGDQLWHQNTAGIKGVAEADDQFGSSLTSGDFNNDGIADVAIGVRNEDIGTLTGAGAVNVIYGSAAGLTSSGDQLYHQNTASINGVAEVGDQFGSSVAAGDFDNDGFADLAIGVRLEAIGSLAGAGAVNVIYGSGSGLTGAGDQLWHQNTAGIKGVAETGDQLGSAVSAGDFDNDGFDDLAIGAPFEAIGSLTAAGAVNVIYGSAAGLTAAGDQLWHQNSTSVNGVAEAYDQFGSCLVAGKFTNSGFSGLAIGVRNESIGAIFGAGAVNVLFGSASGLSAAADQLWHQNTAGIAGVAEANDNFGLAH